MSLTKLEMQELEEQSRPISPKRLLISFTLILNHFPRTKKRNSFSSLLSAWYEEIRARVKQMAWLWLRRSSKTPHHDFKWNLKSCEYMWANIYNTSRVSFLSFLSLHVCVCVYLDNEGLVLEAGGQAQHAHVGRLVNEVLDAVENSTTCGWDTSMDSSLADGLSCHTRMGIDVLHRHAKKIRKHRP